MSNLIRNHRATLTATLTVWRDLREIRSNRIMFLNYNYYVAADIEPRIELR